MAKLIIGNWKMNGTVELVDSFLSQLDSKVIIGLPHIFIAYACLKNENIQISAQDCSIYNELGAHTGEISAKMLAGIGCKYVIIGHSERRKASNFDSVENILKKLKNVISNKMIAILCVDESYERLLDKDTREFIKENVEDIILAYEPLTAIGTGITPTETEIHTVLNKLKHEYFGIMTVYGGSVNSSNAKKILEINSVDGLLIGGASLKLSEINEIARIAEEI